MDVLCVAYGAKPKSFDNELFAGSVKWLQERSAFRFSGEVDLVLLNARRDVARTRLALETNELVAVNIEAAQKDGAITSAPEFMERVFTFADSYTGDDPTWGFSDSEGRKVVGSGLKSLLLAALPKSLKADARSAFHVRVRVHSQ